MHWYPLRLSTPVKQHVFGGRGIAERLGRTGLPDGPVAETWEISDVEGDGSVVTNGPLAGRSLRRLHREHPAAFTGRGADGPRFPLLTKFIDGHRPLPVHVHADDRTARRTEGEPNGKTEAWHILWAAPGATALAGLRPGTGPDDLRRALLAQDFDAVMRRVPVRPGETVYVPAGTLHSFGPGTLVYEIEQTSDVQRHAMRHRMEDGARLTDEAWRAGVEGVLEQTRPQPRPLPGPGLVRAAGDGGPGGERKVLCAGPYFALERWRAREAEIMAHDFGTAVVLSNAGPPVRLVAGGPAHPVTEPVRLGRAESILLPAALGRMELGGPADVLVGYVPDLARDIREPLLAAGHTPSAVAALGEGLDPG